MADSNTLNQAEAVQTEHPANETAEKQVDIRKKPDMAELERLVAEEEGIETPPKPEQAKEEKVIPERYKGKTAEELIAQLEEKEKYIQSRSDEMGNLKKQIAEAEEIKKKVQEIEGNSIIQSQYAGKIPAPPVKPTYTQDEFYNDPVATLAKQQKYVDDLQEWNRKYIDAISRPLLDMSAKAGKEKLFGELEAKYSKYPVKFDRNKIQNFLNTNPDYFTKYGTDAYERAYHDTSVNNFTEESERLRTEIREQERKKLLEEMNTQRQASNIGLSDLATQPINSGSSPAYDEDRMEEDPAYREQVLADIQKRNRR